MRKHHKTKQENILTAEGKWPLTPHPINTSLHIFQDVWDNKGTVISSNFVIYISPPSIDGKSANFQLVFVANREDPSEFLLRIEEGKEEKGEENKREVE